MIAIKSKKNKRDEYFPVERLWYLHSLIHQRQHHGVKRALQYFLRTSNTKSKFNGFLTVHHSVDLNLSPTFMHNFIYSIIILHHDPQHVSSIAVFIFRRIIVYLQYLVSSHSVCCHPVHRLRADCSTYEMCISSHAPSRQRQITIRFTGHCRTVVPQYGNCFVSPFWRLHFGGGLYIFGKFVEPWSKPHPQTPNQLFIYGCFP
jgi:hypothetical protein